MASPEIDHQTLKPRLLIRRGSWEFGHGWTAGRRPVGGMRTCMCAVIKAARQFGSQRQLTPFHLSNGVCAPPYSIKQSQCELAESFPSLPITNESISVSAVSPVLSPSNGL